MPLNPTKLSLSEDKKAAKNKVRAANRVARELQAQNEADGKAREDAALRAAKLPEFKMQARTTVPPSLRVPSPSRPKYMVVKRTNAMPATWNARLMLWAMVHLGPHMNYVATEDQIEAAKGINLMDFFFRCSVVPLACFENVDDVKAYCAKAMDAMPETQTLQTLMFYEENPVPCYANGTDRTIVDEETAVFLKNYNREQRSNYEVQKQRILDLPEQFRKAGEAVQGIDPVSDVPSTAAPTSAAADPSHITSFAQVDTPESIIAGGGNTVTAVAVREIQAINARVTAYEKQIDAARVLISELAEKREILQRQVDDICGDCGSDDDQSDDDQSDDGGDPLVHTTTIRKIIAAPDGTRYKVMLDGTVVAFADGETDGSFHIDPLPEVVQPATVDEPVVSERASAINNIAFGAHSEAYTERIGDMFALVHEQNARNKALGDATRAKEALEALEAFNAV